LAAGLAAFLAAGLAAFLAAGLDLVAAFLAIVLLAADAVFAGYESGPRSVNANLIKL
jgi:hypothetical protein